MPKYNHRDLQDVLEYIYRKGTITAVDSENDLADVTAFGGGSGTDVPLYYHCEPDSELLDNGAIEGAASAFAVDDEVIVMCDTDGNPVRIVGFVDGIKECCWESWGGPNVDSKNPWVKFFNYGGISAEVVDSRLDMHNTGRVYSSGVLSCSINEDPLLNISICSIKATASMYADEGFHSADGNIHITIAGLEEEFVDLTLAYGDTWNSTVNCAEGNPWNRVCLADGEISVIDEEIDISDFIPSGKITVVTISFTDINAYTDVRLLMDHICFK